MSFRSDVRTRIVSDTTISGLVGTRVYGVVRPASSANDYIVVSRLSSVPGHTLASGDGQETGRFQIRCASKTLTTADSIAEAVRNRLQGQNGTWTGTTVFSVMFEDEMDDIDPPIDGEESVLYVVVLIYKIMRGLPVPS